MEEKPEINEEIAQNPPALNKPEKQESKQGNGSKIAIVILAILALAGLGFGIYGFFLKKSEEKTSQNTTDTSEVESELAELKNKYSILQNYVKDLEASGTEISENVKSATETNDIVIKNPVIISSAVKDSQHDDYIETYSIRTSGPVNANGETKYWILSSTEGNLTCKIADQEYGALDSAEDCDVSMHDGKVSNIYYTHIGNGGGAYMLILTENGDVEYLSDSQGEQYNTIKKLNLSNKVNYIYANVNTCSVTPDRAGVFGGCGQTALLVYNNGSIVDLYDIVTK